MPRTILKSGFRRVAVLIETDDTWGRRVVASIANYARRHHWRLLIAPRDDQHRLRLPRRWRGDGILVSLRDRSMADHVRRSAIPAVDVSIMMPDATWIGRVATDDYARAVLAFNHFRDRGLQHFACYAPSIGRYSNERAHAFRDVVHSNRLKCSVFAQKVGNQGWEVDHDQVIEWLSTLPRPLALLAADPYPARQMAEICEADGISVPDEVAILSGDNDELLCSELTPQISSIQLATEKIGAEASRLLERLMQGEPVPESPLLIPPLTVYARQSTNILAIDDAELKSILRFMTDQIQDGVTVAEILQSFPISRRSLEQRFRKMLNRSPAQHLRTIRMEHIKKLLTETDFTVTEIANRSGFRCTSSLTQKFTRHFHLSPTEMRARLRQ